MDNIEKLEVFTRILYEFGKDSYKVSGWLTSKVLVDGKWRRFDTEVSYIDSDLANAIGYVTYFLYKELSENENNYMNWEVEVIN